MVAEALCRKLALSQFYFGVLSYHLKWIYCWINIQFLQFTISNKCSDKQTQANTVKNQIVGKLNYTMLDDKADRVLDSCEGIKNPPQESYNRFPGFNTSIRKPLWSKRPSLMTSKLFSISWKNPSLVFQTGSTIQSTESEPDWSDEVRKVRFRT